MDFEPRRWWAGPLDVERLAWESVSEAVSAAQAIAAARGIRAEVATAPAAIAASFGAIENLRIDGREAVAWAPVSGFVEAADGWVRLHGNYPHHAAAITRALGASTRDELIEAVADMSASEVERAVTAERGLAVAVRSEEEWLAHPHGEVTADDPWVSVDGHGERPALPQDPDEPLGGVRVLDLTRVIAGPTCSQLLACLGADVLRIDRPDRPELLDQYLSNGMGKRSVAVDLATVPEKLEELLATADVVLLGYRPGSLARFGLDPDDLARRHPHLVVGSLSAWGERGPWANRPGFDSIVQAASGIAAQCGSGGRPGALPVQALDHAAGYRMAAHLMRLLAEARAGIVRISLLGAARTLLAYPPPPEQAAAPLKISTVEMPSPHGELALVPPPLTLDGATIERGLTEYAGAELSWNQR
ncbi:MAG: CoA transferase [Dermatophilus congolensis]|nr:CoA transferase [Dermatophilus congolensis]